MIDEKWYLVYVLGYDLLHDEIERGIHNECDVSFDFCCRIIDEFMQSKMYKTVERSAYEVLIAWIYTHYEQIVNKYGLYADYEKWERNMESLGDFFDYEE